MKSFTKEMVDDYANKLLIGLTPEENQMVLDEFEVIDKTINMINQIEGIEKIEPMTHCLDDLEVTLREDIAEPSIPVEEALKNAGAKEGREIEVPKVVD
ncbi:MAG: aspartyl/glutamyl-tRNA amidotransferase subunit C [Ruminococcus sp.]|nr:aspartyl/glutamyl-tRNA amidotransferase subunit C [Ruminococcus sp.]